MFAFWLAAQRETGKDRERERKLDGLDTETKREQEPGETTEWESSRPGGTRQENAI